MSHWYVAESVDPASSDLDLRTLQHERHGTPHAACGGAWGDHAHLPGRTLSPSACLCRQARRLRAWEGGCLWSGGWLVGGS
eukprot:351944-Chlamydomonas_euryale.AAC.3